MTDKKQLLDLIEADIRGLNVSESEKIRLMENFSLLRNRPVNILITGSTGCGKSSTINALFGSEVAKVGVGVEPTTEEVKSYKLANLILWDSPGFGDGKEADKRNSENIIRMLNEVDDKGTYVIDLVLVILDASSKDLGTSYDLINDVIIPNLGTDGSSRILVGLNQADNAMKGRHWNYEKNFPDEVLTKYLDKKVISVQERIKSDTGVNIKPIFYCAGFKEEGFRQADPFNISGLIYYIIKYIPKEKRIAFVEQIKENVELQVEVEPEKREEDGFASKIMDELSALLSD